MRLLESSSLTKRLSLLFSLANLFSLGLSFIGFSILVAYFSLAAFTTELKTVAQLVASSSRAAVAFSDAPSAARVVSALQEKDNIVYVALLGAHQDVLASLGTSPRNREGDWGLSVGGILWTLRHATISRPIILDGEHIGSVEIIANLSSLYQQLGFVALFALGLIAIGLAGVVYTSRILRARVAGPIENLRTLAQHVSLTKDFSERLEASNEDEINELIKAFNHMLAQLEERDRSLVLAKERAEAAVKAKSLFVAQISHELRTPLHAILGMTREALDSSLSIDQRDLIETAHGAGDSLLSIINDILDYSKIEAGKLELSPSVFEFPLFMEQTVKMFERLCRPKGITLLKNIDQSIPRFIVADSGRLSQIFVNLLGNAHKFTPPGGQITLSVARRSQEELSHEGELGLNISVRDTGIGIPPELQESIFDSFTQIHRPGEVAQGTGLGLSIVARLIKMMGGWIWVESKVGEGSIFRLVLSVRVPDSSQLPEGCEENSPPQTPTVPPLLVDRAPNQETRRILLVEDNPVNRKLAERILKKANYEVTSAVHGLECLELMKTQTFDLILMDVNMPELDGVETTQAIRQREELEGIPRIPIFALTANAASEDCIRCAEAGMDRFLTKPIDRETLINAIEETLGQRADSKLPANIRT